MGLAGVVYKSDQIVMDELKRYLDYLYDYSLAFGKVYVMNEKRGEMEEFGNFLLTDFLQEFINVPLDTDSTLYDMLVAVKSLGYGYNILGTSDEYLAALRVFEIYYANQGNL